MATEETPEARAAEERVAVDDDLVPRRRLRGRTKRADETERAASGDAAVESTVVGEDLVPQRGGVRERPSDIVATTRSVFGVLYAVTPQGRLSERLVGPWTLSWAAVILPVCVVLGDGALASVAVGVALYRVAEISLSRIVTVLDDPPAREPRADLLISAVHLVEIALVVAVAHRWQTGMRGGLAVIEGFEAVMFRSVMFQPGNWLDAVTVAATAATLVVWVSVALAVVRLGVDRR